MQVQWTASAESDQEKLIAYITQDSPTPALSQLDEIQGQTDLLADYSKLDRLGRVKGTRELVVNRTSFIIVYRIKGRAVQILWVLHGAQQWP
jgi:toxin ParE1/3/4